MPTRPRVLHFDVTVDRAGDAHSALGEAHCRERSSGGRSTLCWPDSCAARSRAWTTLPAAPGSTRRGVGSAHGTVTKRDDGLYAFVAIETALEIDIAPAPEAAALQELVARAEHGCFVSNSLTARPRHRWIVNGQEVL